MDTLADGMEAMREAIDVLQMLLNEETLEYFTAPYTQTTQRAGRRMLEIGPLLYSRPFDALHISLWETLAAMHPEIEGDEAYARSLFRGATWELTKTVKLETTWDELEATVVCEMLEHRVPSNGSRVVPIH
jgi:hypothetical protein